MTKEEKQKAIAALKMSAPIFAMTYEKFNDYIQTLNKVMDWLEQEPCEDCISKSQALKEMQESAKHHANDSREEALLRRDRDIIRALPLVKRQEPKWIPVSERLPEKEKEVLVSGYDTYGKKIIIARYQGEQYGFTCGLVPAWMPLPKPYKAESEDKE